MFALQQLHYQLLPYKQHKLLEKKFKSWKLYVVAAMVPLPTHANQT